MIEGLTFQDFIKDDLIPYEVKKRLVFKLCVKSPEGRKAAIAVMKATYPDFVHKFPSDEKLDFWLQIPGLEPSETNLEDILALNE